MSIYSDTLPDDEFQFLANRENRRDRIDAEDDWMENSDCLDCILNDTEVCPKGSDADKTPCDKYWTGDEEEPQ